MGRPSKHSSKVRERAVRLVKESVGDQPSEWAATSSVASTVGCTPETLRKWVHRAERDSGCPTGDAMVYETVTGFLEILRRRESPAAREETRADAIEQIQFAGPNLAFVRARCRVAERHFTDLLTLIRDAGRWRIVAKVFHHDRWLDPEAARCPTSTCRSPQKQHTRTEG